MNFESWRDFSLEGEHDIEDAHDRYEKRWMIKENERKAKVIDRFCYCLAGMFFMARDEIQRKISG